MRRHKNRRLCSLISTLLRLLRSCSFGLSSFVCLAESQLTILFGDFQGEVQGLDIFTFGERLCLLQRKSILQLEVRR